MKAEPALTTLSPVLNLPPKIRRTKIAEQNTVNPGPSVTRRVEIVPANRLSTTNALNKKPITPNTPPTNRTSGAL